MGQSDIKTTVNQATGNWLKRLRAEKNLSQTELQNYLDVSRSYISNVEQGKKPLPLWRILQLGRALKVDPSTAVQEIAKEVFANER